MIKTLFAENLRTIAVALSFAVTVYVQHVVNTKHIEEMTLHINVLEAKVQDQYDRIDAIKLDKTVFEATMLQFSNLQTDIREMREDIKELLKNSR
ncbi:hypothetical protein [uncultured Bacteroides sp.]|uniref:hypothetical protein n=1 Tax=uncultured Bacteroides sp. TaxID=162156 RepID=UPI0025969C93|nr:hypothetical protein [uncultured Bacteroides sp.]